MVGGRSQLKHRSVSLVRVGVHRILNQLFGDRNSPVALPVLTGPGRGMWLRTSDLGEAMSMNQVHTSRASKALSEICQVGWTVWDCTSSEGISTVLFSRFVGVDGFVVSFETNRSHFLQIYDNATLNGCNNILFLFATVGMPAAKTRFKPPVCARQLSLDEAYQDGEVPIPHLIRLVLNGASVTALSHAERLFREQRPILVVDANSNEGYTALKDFTAKFEYAMQSLEDGAFHTDPSKISGSILCSPLPQTR